MRIGIVSDSHGQIATVSRALAALTERRVELVLHCGDIDDAETVQLFRELPTHFVFGNCDTDKVDLKRAMKEIGATLHEPFGNLELGGKRLAWLHGDDRTLFRDVEKSEHFDYLFYGHTHVAEQHQSGATLVINPGALHRARQKSILVLDLESDVLESIPIP